MLARRMAAAAAATSTAAGCAWLCTPPAEPAGPPRALIPGQPLLSQLVSKQWASDDAVRLRFALPSSEHKLGLPVPGHLVVVDAATNYRPYSPTTIDATSTGFFELLVRVYPRGEFSRKLAALEPGDEASFFGPMESRYEYRRGTTPHLGLLAAGTGITPLWQIIQRVLSDADDTTCLSLVYSSRSAEGILLKDELDAAAAAHPTRLRVCYLVTPPADGAPGAHSAQDAMGARDAQSTQSVLSGTSARSLPSGVRYGRLTDAALLADHLPPPPDSSAMSRERAEDACQLIVSGPDALLLQLCGPRARDGGMRAGPEGTAKARHPAIGGVLRALGYRSNQVTWL